MHKYVAAAFSIAIAIGPAAAGQAGVGGRCRDQCQRQSVSGSWSDGDVNRDWREYRWLGRSGRSIGRHRQRIGRRKHWSQRRRRKRRAVGRRWGSRLVRDWRSRRQPRRCLTLNGEPHCCHDGQPCPG